MAKDKTDSTTPVTDNFLKQLNKLTEANDWVKYTTEPKRGDISLVKAVGIGHVVTVYGHIITSLRPGDKPETYFGTLGGMQDKFSLIGADLRKLASRPTKGSFDRFLGTIDSIANSKAWSELKPADPRWKDILRPTLTTIINELGKNWVEVPLSESQDGDAIFGFEWLPEAGFVLRETVKSDDIKASNWLGLRKI